MEQYENLLPPDEQTDQHIALYWDELEAYFEENRAENAAQFGKSYDEIFDHQVELNELMQPQHAWQYSYLLARHAEETGEPPYERIKTAYRANVFAGHMLNILAKGEPRTIESHGYFEATNRFEDITADTQDYLSTRQYVDALIGYYMPEIDPGGQHNDFAETIAALNFMLHERREAQQLLTGDSLERMIRFSDASDDTRA